MNRIVVAAITSLLATFVALSASGAVGDGELTVAGATVSGDFGTGTEIDSQRLTVRYVTGNDWQFYTALSVIRVETSPEVTYTGLGPTSMGANGRQGRQGNSGSSEEIASPSLVDTTAPTMLHDRSKSGLGDLRLALSRRIFGGGARVFRSDASIEVKAPTANEEENLGTGEWDYRVGWAAEYRFWPCTAFGGLGWNKLGDPAWVDFNDVFDAYVGMDSNPVAGERLIVSGWLEGWQEAVAAAGSRAALGLGLRTTGKTRWRLQVRTGLTDASEDVDVILGFSFGVSPHGPGVRTYQR
jgi:hypothetical protein